jgi:formiminotetrahydrofolate cyclodeaminase
MGADVSYSYDRTAAESPANVLRNTGRALHTIERDLGHTEASLKGLLNQLTMMARSTHDKNVKANYESVLDLKTRFEKLHKEAKNLAELFDEGSREYR